MSKTAIQLHNNACSSGMWWMSDQTLWKIIAQCACDAEAKTPQTLLAEACAAHGANGYPPLTLLKIIAQAEADRAGKTPATLLSEACASGMAAQSPLNLVKIIAQALADTDT